MNVVNYLKENGIKRAFQVIYRYKIDMLMQAILKPFFKNAPLKDIIMIESHNDFDCNGGAFYNYLVEKGYNKKYKIVWLLKHPELAPKHLPENVECLPLFKPSIKKDIYAWTARIFTADNTVFEKRRDEQKSFYLGHGAGGLKSVLGKLTIPDNVDYILMQSESYAPIQARTWSVEYPDTRIVTLGYPSHDILATPHFEELSKITEKKYKKIVLWMPTFRKGILGRSDSNAELPLGIPLIKNISDYTELNNILCQENILLIIKLHPMQDISDLKLHSMSNIEVLTGMDVKEKNIDSYRLMSAVDALISDYSGAAYEFLQVNKPIAYVLDDMKDYKLGFVVEDIDTLIAGEKIYTFDDFKNFIHDVGCENDNFKERRIEIRNYIYQYSDGENCKRLADFMNL